MKITEFKLKSGITGLLMHDWKSSKLSEYFKTDKIVRATEIFILNIKINV